MSETNYNFKFSIPDDESLASYISIRGEKGERGDPTKTSQLENDSDFTTNAALSSGLATKANATTVQSLTTQVNANTNALETLALNHIVLQGDLGSGKRYYKIATLPEQMASSNRGNIVIHGKMGVYESAEVGHVDITLLNRANGVKAYGDYNSSGTTASQRTDIVAYQEEDTSVTVYLCGTSWVNINLTLSPAGDATVDYDSETYTTSPTGTKVWSLLEDNTNVQKNIAGTISANIDGDAQTVNGHTVEADVPSDAVFTDTLYDDTLIQADIAQKANTTDVASTYATKTELGTLGTRVDSLSSGSPLVASSMSQMTDTTRTYVLTTDGHWYYYTGSAWADGGVYQATEVANDSIGHSKIVSSELPYDDGNMVDWRSDFTEGGYIVGSTGLVAQGVSSSGLKYYSDFIEVEPNTTYYRKGCLSNVIHYDAEKNRIGNEQVLKNISFVTPATAKYVRISLGPVTSVAIGDYDISTFILSKNSSPTLPFVYSIDQLYERSNCYLEYRTDISGGLGIDWANNKIVIRNCISCSMRNNKEVTVLKNSSTTKADFELYDFGDTNVSLYWDTKTKTITSVNAVSLAKTLSNNYIPIGYVNKTNHTAYISGYGAYSENTRGYVYYRPADTTNHVSWSRSGTNVTINFPQGTFYTLSKSGIYQASGTHPAHAAATYTLSSSQKLMLNTTTYEVYVKTLSNANANYTDGVDIMLLLNVSGKLCAGALLPDLLWQNAEFNGGGSTAVTDINSDNFFDFVFSSSYSGEASDCTFVGDELWFFHPSNDAHTDYALCRRYSIDFENKTATQLGTFNHNFGHCNTVDYCEDTDTLILGNGGGSGNTENDQIFIIENASSMKNNAQNSLASVAKIIDLDNLGLDWGKQVNVCWGEANNGEYNVAYALSNDGTTKFIRKVLLGKGSNQLTYGTMLSVGDNEFNGTFKVLGTYTSDYSATICNQGSQYYRGSLYEGIGHDGAWVHKSTLSQDGKIYRVSYHERFYSDDGTIPYSYHECIAIKDGYAIITQSSPAGGSRSLMVYKI